MNAKGPGAYNMTKQIFSNPIHGMATNGRYLGPMIDWCGDPGVEIGIRLRKANCAFGMYCKLWSSNMSRKYKLNVFVAVIFNILVDSLHLYVLSNRQEKRFSVWYMCKLRRLCKGLACEKRNNDDHTVYKGKSDRHIRKMLGAPRLSEHIRYKRLRFSRI